LVHATGLLHYDGDQQSSFIVTRFRNGTGSEVLAYSDHYNCQKLARPL
jgi:hypothetical protein